MRVPVLGGAVLVREVEVADSSNLQPAGPGMWLLHLEPSEGEEAQAMKDQLHLDPTAIVEFPYAQTAAWNHPVAAGERRSEPVVSSSNLWVSMRSYSMTTGPRPPAKDHPVYNHPSYTCPSCNLHASP